MQDLSRELSEMTAQLAQLQAQLAALSPATAGHSSVVENPTTVAQLIECAKSTCKTSSLRTYRSAWNVLHEKVEVGPSVSTLGDRVLQVSSMLAHEVTPAHLEAYLPLVRRRAKERNDAQDLARYDAGRMQRAGNGEAAVYNAIGAWRKLFSVAIANRSMGSYPNPALSLKKPSRVTANRTWLTDDQIGEVLHMAATTGDDPVLDGLLCRFHLITGARQEGALNLRVRHVDASGCAVLLSEKLDKKVWQPVPDWFARELLDFAASRGSTGADDAVFVKRLKSGAVKAISPRRYNYLFERLQSSSEWMDRAQVTAHTLRHCAGKLVERHAGMMVAQGFLRHATSSVTGRYTVAKPHEVAQAVIDLWGGRHPLAASEGASNGSASSLSPT